MLLHSFSGVVGFSKFTVSRPSLETVQGALDEVSEQSFWSKFRLPSLNYRISSSTSPQRS